MDGQWLCRRCHKQQPFGRGTKLQMYNFATLLSQDTCMLLVNFHKDTKYTEARRPRNEQGHIQATLAKQLEPHPCLLRGASLKHIMVRSRAMHP
eukprot:scaffold125389_cov20-Tisochrysis_lutea.AAC.1